MKKQNHLTKENRMNSIRLGALIFGLLAALSFAIAIPNIFENLDAHDIMVIQSPLSGELSVYTDPGVKMQWFGKVTVYPRQRQYTFQADGNDIGTAKRLRFNDGGHANLSGAISWEMPLSNEDIIKIHKTYGSADSIEQQAVAKMIDNAVYLSGPLMSSTESSGERRSDLVQFINDQAEKGVYMTQNKQMHVKDGITNDDATITVSEIIRDANGNPRRQQGSILQEFNIKLLPLSINNLQYDAIVEDQIAKRQKSTTDVQIPQANAKKAVQDAITTSKQGEASAATAKWAQETINAKEIAEAEKDKRVAELRADKAALFKREQILIGEGEAQRRQLVMTADGALDKKLDAYIKAQEMWATAFQNYKGQMVPQMVMGGSGNSNQSSINSAQQFMDLITAKTAKDLSLDMVVTGKNATRE